MIEFKQIIGRGTRLFDGKDYFTIYDFVRAYEHFNPPARQKIKIKLADGKERVLCRLRACIFRLRRRTG
jgi:type I restriction enzyme R subunit